VYGAVVCSYDAVSLFYLELYVKLSIYLSIYLFNNNCLNKSSMFRVDGLRHGEPPTSAHCLCFLLPFTTAPAEDELQFSVRHVFASISRQTCSLHHRTPNSAFRVRDRETEQR
jgi:hypothetical protein